MDYKKDYYAILEIQTDASIEQIRAAYRRLAKLHHPDKNPGDPGAEERFKLLNEANATLSNELTRQIYDRFRADQQKAQEDATHSTKQQKANAPPHKTKKTRTQTIHREKRIYVQGTIVVKFHGEPALTATADLQRERSFIISPTEVSATITSSSIYNNPPEEYQTSYAAAEIFACAIKQPVYCKIITGEQHEHYHLDLHDIRIADPLITDVTKHEQYSFGTLTGNLFAYVLYAYEEKITEEYTEYSGATGKIDTKVEGDNVFIRSEYYAQDGSTYWTGWHQHTAYSKTRRGHQRTPAYSYTKQSDFRSNWGWLITLLVMGFLWPPLWLFILPFIALLVFTVFSGWLAAAFKGVVRLFCLAAMLVLATWACWPSQRTGYIPRQRVKNNYDSISTTNTVTKNGYAVSDSLIVHQLRWEDYDGARYNLQVSVSGTLLHQSSAAHQQMNEQHFARGGFKEVYQYMLDHDKPFINTLASSFDSLFQAKKTEKADEANMVVSCIQSIPYALVVDGSCTDHYSDSYIQQYLSTCNGNCCKAYSKFGVQSPVEFMADLKGDCDTRALLLYGVLGKLGYKSALLTSSYYKHALIAVSLNKPDTDNQAFFSVNGQPYYLWETTSKGFRAGEIPPSLRDLDKWTVTLTQ